MNDYEVIILKTGYCLRQGKTARADGTVTLIRGPVNIIVDTGSPPDRQHIIDGLAREGLTPDDIDYAVCTHGHSDHVGNNNLFPGATFIVSHDISKGDEYSFHDFNSGAPYMIGERIEVIATPGHTSQDISVIVKTKEGVYAVAGDLFECKEDLENEELWKASSELPVEQKKSRAKLLAMADFIVPGHGEMFEARKK